MGVSQSGLSSGQPTPKGLLLVGVTILAVVLAFAAKKSGEDRFPEPTPTPSASISAS